MIDLRHGDCLEVLPTLPADSVDAIVTDPPYALMDCQWNFPKCPKCELRDKDQSRVGDLCQQCSTPLISGRYCRGKGFMGLDWDNGSVAFNPATWAAVLRVAKPGAYLCAFGGTRTFHRLACAIEDGGWQIRDTLCWMYGQGFPKGKAALKPAWEPVILARKPGKRVEPLQIDACRVGVDDVKSRKTAMLAFGGQNARPSHNGHETTESYHLGRWPANILFQHSKGCRCVGVKRVKASHRFVGCKGVPGNSLSGSVDGTLNVGPSENRHADADGLETVEDWICDESCPIKLLDEQSGNLHAPISNGKTTKGNVYNDGWPELPKRPSYTDSGGASRFFTRFRYCPKAGRRERGEGNNHPTVKPVKVIEWLVKLITPEGGTVLDLFAGSFTTGVACVQTGRKCIGIERDEEYVKIGHKRMAEAQGQVGLFRAPSACGIAGKGR